MKAIYVEWDDSSSYASTVWKDRDEITKNKVCRCKTVGFVLKETKDSVTLAGSTDGGNYVSGDMTIPKSAIRKRRVAMWKK